MLLSQWLLTIVTKKSPKTPYESFFFSLMHLVWNRALLDVYKMKQTVLSTSSLTNYTTTIATNIKEQAS